MLVRATCSRTPEIRGLLALAMFKPDAARLDALCARYDADASMLLFGWRRRNATIGVVGIQVITPGSAVVRHIAVYPAERRRGVARRMLDRLIADHGLRRLEAETDGEAVGFYRRCGFEVVSLGETYPGVERFRCTLMVDRAGGHDVSANGRIAG